MLKEFCEIGFTEDNEFIIIPESSILLLVQAIRKSNNDLVKEPLETVLPHEFVQYVVKVINTNRGHKKFEYNYIKDDIINEQDVVYVASRQLTMLTADNIRCFTEVFITESKTMRHFVLKVDPKVQVIICEGRKGIVISKYN